MKQAHLFIGGYVQSVGFRRFVQSKANKRGITGWVRNLPDGRVEVVAQGEKESIESLIAVCRKGPFMADVKSVSVSWEESEKVFEDFALLPTPST